MSESIETIVMRCVAAALSIPENRVSMEDGWHKTNEWDSMAQIDVTTIEKQFNISIPDELIEKLITVPLLCEYVKNVKGGITSGTN